MSDKKLIAANTVYNSIGQGVQVLTTVIIIPFIIYRLGVELYGIWAILSGLANQYGLLDFGSAYVKYVAEYKAKDDGTGLKEIITTGFYCNLFIALVASLAGLLFRDQILSLFIKDISGISDISRVYTGTIFLFFMAYMSQFFQSVLDGYQRMDLKNAGIVIHRILNFVLVIIMISRWPSLLSVVLAGLISWAVLLVINLYQIKVLFREFSLSFSHFSRAKLNALLSFGWRVQLTVASGWIMNNSDKLFLGYFTNLSVVSIYDIAYKIKNLARIPVTSYALSIIPAASEISVSSVREKIKEFYYEHNKYLLLIIFPVCGFIMVNAAGLVNLWVGSGFEQAAIVLRILMVGNILNLMTAVGTSMARGINRPGIESKYMVLITVLMLILGYFLAKNGGLIGLSIGSTMAVGIPSLWFILLMNKYLVVSDIKYFREIVGMPVIAVIAVSAFDYALAGAINPWITGKLAYSVIVSFKFAAYTVFYLLILRWLDYFDFFRYAKKFLGSVRKT